METPTSDFGSNGDITPSDASTPTSPYEPFEAQFKVKVTEPVKDGEFVNYTVKTTRKTDGQEFVVVRQYEDFEWLNHCIITRSDIYGLIVPPLPLKPVVDAKEAEHKSKQHLGSTSKVLIGDEFHKDCRGLEKYLRLLLAHNVLGKDRTLVNFLTEKDPPLRAKVKKGIIGKITSAVEEARKANHKDIDEYFEKEREWANRYAAAMKEVSTNFNKVLYSQQRIAGAYGHLSTALNLGGGCQDEENTVANRLLVKLSEAVDDAKHGADVDLANDENTLGFHLDLSSRYADAVKEMLFRRTCLLVAYEDSNKDLSKAKPQKREAAEKVKVAAEQAFEECSDVASHEIVMFKKEQLMAFQDALCLFSEAKVKTARDTYALLAKSLSLFKQMEV